MVRTKNIEEIIESGGLENIPLDAIREARNALANEFVVKKEALDRASLITRMHKKRIQSRVTEINKYLDELDIWLKEVGQ